MTADVVNHPAGPRRHRWGDRKIIASCDTPDGNERQERVCALCSMTRITVIGAHGLPWHEWRTAKGMVAQLDHTPPCLDQPNPEKQRQSP